MQSIRPERNPACPVCVHGKYSYLEGRAQPHITLCGRDSVQIHERYRSLDLRLLQEKLTSVAEGVRQNGFLLKALLPPYELTVFPDGRAIFKGTQDPAVARSLYAKYIGS